MNIAADRTDEEKQPLIDLSDVAKEDAPVTPPTAAGRDGPPSEWPDEGPLQEDEKGEAPTPTIPIPPAD